MKKLIGVIILLAVIGTTAFASASETRKEAVKVVVLGPFIGSFDACVKAGFPVTEGSLPRCKVSDHKIFFGISRGADTAATTSVSKTPISANTVPSSSPMLPSEPEVFDPLKNADITVLPKQVLLDVPFTPQAPLANWDPPFDEACEEASIIMVDRFLSGRTLNTEEATTAIVELASWEKGNGYAIDATAAEAAEIAQKYFGLKAKLYSGADVSIQNIKRLVASGFPVIIPAAGRDLGNPYFSGEGPPYHMLVIIGYKGDKFVTNDPGTKRGAKYVYSQDVIMNAIHDWTGTKETIRQGKKTIFVLGK